MSYMEKKKRSSYEISRNWICCFLIRNPACSSVVSECFLFLITTTFMYWTRITCPKIVVVVRNTFSRPVTIRRNWMYTRQNHSRYWIKEGEKSTRSWFFDGDYLTTRNSYISPRLIRDTFSVRNKFEIGTGCIFWVWSFEYIFKSRNLWISCPFTFEI